MITNIELDKNETPQPLIINVLCDVLEINQEWLIKGIGEMSNLEAFRSSKVLSKKYSISKELS